MWWPTIKDSGLGLGTLVVRNPYIISMPSFKAYMHDWMKSCTVRILTTSSYVFAKIYLWALLFVCLFVIAKSHVSLFLCVLWQCCFRHWDQYRRRHKEDWGNFRQQNWYEENHARDQTPSPLISWKCRNSSFLSLFSFLF